MGQEAGPRPDSNGHIITDVELADRAGSISLNDTAHVDNSKRTSSNSAQTSSTSCQPSTSGTLPESYPAVSDRDQRPGVGTSGQPWAAQPGAGNSATGQNRQSPSWEEKGKFILVNDDFKTPERPVRPQRRGVGSVTSSRGSSPRSMDPGTSQATSSSASPYTSPEVKTVTAALQSKSPDAQIRALKKLRLDLELCRSLTDEDRGIQLVVALLSPARSWLPSFGCSDVQTTAAATVVSFARVSSARRKIAGAGGIPALVNLLNTGSTEAQSHAGKALGILAEEPSLSFQVGQAGGCAPLVKMLTSATALHSSLVSLQMTTDHEEAQAHAAAALANLAKTSANQAKIVEAGGIAPIILLLSSESGALQASAASCLHSLASAPPVAEQINNAGASETLLLLLDSEEACAQAAAAEAVGVIICNERAAAKAIPKLVKMLSSDLSEVRTSSARGLAYLAHDSTINKVKIAGEPGLLSTLIHQLLGAEVQLKLAARLDSMKHRVEESPLMPLLEGALGRSGTRSLSKLAQQVKVPLNNSTNVPDLVTALRQGAEEEQLAVARVLGSLAVEGFSQSKILEAGLNCLLPLTRLLRSANMAVKAKAAAALANLASVDTDAIRKTGCEEALVLAAKANSEARVPAMRCLLNLSDDEASLDGFVRAGCIPVLLSALSAPGHETQKLAAATLANFAVSPKLRELVVQGGGLPPLIELLGGNNAKVQAAAAAALWQLSGDKAVSEEMGLIGCPKAAIHALKSSFGTAQENVAGLVASLAQSQHNAVLLTIEGGVEHMLPLLRSRITEVQAYAADALRCFATVKDKNCLVIATSSIPTLTLLLGSPSPDAQQSAAGCLAALAANPEVRDRIGQSGAIPHLVQLLRTGRSQAREAAAAALTNLAINNSANLKEFVRAGGIGPLKQLLGSNSSAGRAMEGVLSSLGGGAPKTPIKVATARREEGSPSSSQEIDDQGTPSAQLVKRRSWRSPSMVLDQEVPTSPVSGG